MIDTKKILDAMHSQTGRSYAEGSIEMDLIRMLALALDQYDTERAARAKDLFDDAARNLSNMIKMANDSATHLKTTTDDSVSRLEAAVNSQIKLMDAAALRWRLAVDHKSNEREQSAGPTP